MTAKNLAVAAMAALMFAVVASAVPQPAAAQDQACVKREMAKGRSACLAKLKCEGVTSRKEQARRCGG